MQMKECDNKILIDFFSCNLAAPWPALSQIWGKYLTKTILSSAFNSMFNPNPILVSPSAWWGLI